MRTLGLFLALIGGAIVLTGIALAIRALAGLYDASLADPLGGGETREKDTARSMFTALAIGAAGAIPLLAGTIMLKATLIRRLRRRL